MKNIILILFVAICLISIVSAAQPVTTTQQFADGYIIEDSPQSIIKKNQSYQYNFFLYNVSNTLSLSNTGISCFYYLANSKGEVVLMSNATYFAADGHWGLKIDAGNFSTVGFYAYGTKCNSTRYGGTTTGLFEVTNSGLPYSFFENSNTEFSIYIILFLCIIFLILYLSTKDTYFKWFYFAVFFLFLVISVSMSFIVMNSGDNFESVSSIYDTLSMIFFYSLWLVFGLLFFFLVWKLYLEYMGMAALKEAERFGTEMDFTKFNKGFS